VRAPAEGYTLLYATSANAVNAALYDKLNLVRDIAPVVVVGIVCRIPRMRQCNSRGDRLGEQGCFSRLHASNGVSALLRQASKIFLTNGLG